MAKEWIVPDADLGCDGAYFDYQELVRCMDCKWFEPLPNRPDRKGFCHIWGALDEPRYNVESGYCSYGRQKDGADMTWNRRAALGGDGDG